jgi:methylmalonyl-CoA mutase cobalamin-binding subunit
MCTQGPTATQAIRAMGCDSFIVGVTGNLFPEDVAYFKESGAQAVLGKPLLLEELLDLWAEYGVLRE